MAQSGWFGVGIGLVGVGFGVHAVVSGEVRIVWSRFGGWGSMASTASRYDQPILFWLATAFYVLGGLAIAGAGLHGLFKH